MIYFACKGLHIWFLNQSSVWQQVGAEFAEQIGVIALMTTGILMFLSIAGIRISERLGTTIVGGIFGAIGYVCRTIIQAIGWVIRQIVAALPRLYRWARDTALSMGASRAAANVIGAIVALVFLIVII